MSTKLTLDKAGRVVIPKPLRDRLALRPGDELELKASGEQIILRPFRATSPLQRENGIWVYRSGGAVNASILGDVIEQVREERSREVMR